jgi:hypothetical protein
MALKTCLKVKPARYTEPPRVIQLIASGVTFVKIWTQCLTQFNPLNLEVNPNSISVRIQFLLHRKDIESFAIIGVYSENHVIYTT